MSERDIPAPQPDQAPKSLWPVDAMAEALRAETELVEDHYFGRGTRYRVGLSQTTVDTWEQHRYVRVQAEKQLVAGAELEPALIDERGVSFHGTDDQSRWIIVNRDGQTFSHIPPSSPVPIDYLERLHAGEISSTPLTEAPREALPEPSRVEPATQEEPSSEVGGENAAETPHAVSEPPAETEREKNNKVDYTGNIAWEPKFREFQSGNTRLPFSIAIHMEDGSTEYKTVKAFGERAKRYNGQIHKGQAVRIVGGRAYETVTDKDGAEKKREFVILWGLKHQGEGRS